MTRDEQWAAKWQEVFDVMESYYRNPSKHRIEEYLMLNNMTEKGFFKGIGQFFRHLLLTLAGGSKRRAEQ